METQRQFTSYVSVFNGRLLPRRSRLACIPTPFQCVIQCSWSVTYSLRERTFCSADNEQDGNGKGACLFCDSPIPHVQVPSYLEVMPMEILVHIVAVILPTTAVFLTRRCSSLPKREALPAPIVGSQSSWRAQSTKFFVVWANSHSSKTLDGVLLPSSWSRLQNREPHLEAALLSQTKISVLPAY